MSEAVVISVTENLNERIQFEIKEITVQTLKMEEF